MSILTRIPAVQEFIAREIAEAASSYLETKVSVGRVQIGIINRFIIDDVKIEDRSGRNMLSASRVSVKVNPLSFFSDKIELTSGQLFGADININAPAKGADLNCQFVIDLLKPGKKKKEEQGLEIKSLVIRRGRIRYDILDQPDKKNMFDPNHIDVKNVSGHLVFNQDVNGNANIKLKKLSFIEKSGFEVSRLSFRLNSNEKGLDVSDLAMILPHTSLNIPEAHLKYKKQNGRIVDATISYEASADDCSVVLSDFSPLEPAFKNFSTPLVLNSNISGTSTSLRVRNFILYSSDRKIDINAEGSLNNFSNPTWAAGIKRFVVNAGTINLLKTNFGNKNVSELEVLSRLGDIRFNGSAGGSEKHISLKGNLMSGAGSATLALGKKGNNFNGALNTPSLDLGKITARDDFGKLTARIEFDGTLRKNSKIPDITARGTVSSIDYKQHTYKDITVDGTYSQKKFDGLLSIDDPDARIKLQGIVSYSGDMPTANFNAEVAHFNPNALGLTNKWKDAVFDMNVNADIDGKDANSAKGFFEISDFTMITPSDTLNIDAFNILAGNRDGGHYLSMRSDFADADVEGHYSYKTLAQSMSEILGRRLPSIIPYDDSKSTAENEFTLHFKLKDTQWMKMLLGVPADISSPIMVNGSFNDADDFIKLNCKIPQLSYGGDDYRDGHIDFNTSGDSIKFDAAMSKALKNGYKMDMSLRGAAAGNKLSSCISWANDRKKPFLGSLNVLTEFVKNDDGTSETRMNFNPSEISLGDVKWFVRPSSVTLADKEISVDNFTAENDTQHLIISGKATENASDSIVVSMRDIEIASLLDMVEKKAVYFSGSTSGRASIASVFGKPKASAELTVNDFRFQGGLLGKLHADVNWNDKVEQLELDAVADDHPIGKTYISGYFAPKKNYLWVDIGARNMRAEFLQGFCKTFMNNVTATLQGDAVVCGPLNRIELLGDLNLNGGLGIKSLGTNYNFDNVMVHCDEDEIRIRNGRLTDATGGEGVFDGVLKHQSFHRIRYDFDIQSQGLPMYNTTAERGDNFYGKVFIDGNCHIHGGLKDVMIDVDAVPVKESSMVYDASAPDAINNRNFITWKTPADTIETDVEGKELFSSTDIRMNMNVDVTSALQLKVLLDKSSGDNLVLRGDGSLRANYYNKGPFSMFGTYNIHEGNYRLTIQKILEKNFRIQNGSRIVFSGDPYDAALNLNATHTVNGVSLSDLKIGKSFSNNTIRVNCIMGIHGTPTQPKVDFDIDMPTVDGEVQQMIRSMITTEEDMNRQVVYILGIGRFYVPEDNNMDSETGPSQTSLAMQSLLSGTISSQINSLMGRIINSNHWNFGANISTGDEGWNNAEYEGIITGKMLNNRLLINGQFGYRDNANATTGFIGDFDIRYLLFPSGNVAVRLYNQTNDRYFTKTSLNTQGVGLILKKDFFNLKDLLGIGRKKKNKDKDQPERRTILEAKEKEETIETK